MVTKFTQNTCIGYVLYLCPVHGCVFNFILLFCQCLGTLNIYCPLLILCWVTLIWAASIWISCQWDKCLQTALSDSCFYWSVLYIKISDKFNIDLCVAFLNFDRCLSKAGDVEFCALVYFDSIPIPLFTIHSCHIVIWIFQTVHQQLLKV